MSRFFRVIQSTLNLRNNVEFLAWCVINTQKIKNYSKKELLWLRMDENQMNEFDIIRLEFLGWTNRDGLILRSVVSVPPQCTLQIWGGILKNFSLFQVCSSPIFVTDSITQRLTDLIVTCHTVPSCRLSFLVMNMITCYQWQLERSRMFILLWQNLFDYSWILELDVRDARNIRIENGFYLYGILLDKLQRFKVNLRPLPRRIVSGRVSCIRSFQVKITPCTLAKRTSHQNSCPLKIPFHKSFRNSDGYRL